MSTITVCICTIPGREEQLRRAVASVHDQKRKPDALMIELDRNRMGAAYTRNTLLSRVETDFIAWLDDDDYLLPNHLRGLERTQPRFNADVVYSPWLGINTRLFAPELFRTQWGPEHERLQLRGNFLPITTLQRTEAVRAVGGFSDMTPGVFLGEDAMLYQRLVKAGFTFACHPVETWFWPPNPLGHTSGRGNNA